MGAFRLPVFLGAVAALAAGCGGSSSPSFPTIGAAKTFHVADFAPAAAVVAGKPTAVTLRIVQPSGQTLTQYRRGAGPHTGVHLIFVRSDLSEIVHHHPPIGKDGVLHDSVVLPSAGRWRLVIDAYPAATQQPNFQLFEWVTVKGDARAEPMPAFKATQVVDGFRFTVHGTPHIRAIQAANFEVDVTNPQGKPAHFAPWFGATAHAIFFREGTLAYYHTHICAPGQTACSSLVAGAATVVGKSQKPGQLKVGVLLAQGGTWRMFVQCKADGKVLSAPFTLQVAG
jgi:hypothetical protein